MGNSAAAFKKFIEVSFGIETPEKVQQQTNEYFRNFIYSTQKKLDLLEFHLKKEDYAALYNLLPELKFLVEYSDELSRYWYFMRGYSGALLKLSNDLTVKGSKKLYAAYFEKYGDRRNIRDEHWFEVKRWEFLDELNTIYNEFELKAFMWKYHNVLSDNLKIYSSFMMAFINDLKKLQAFEKVHGHS